MSQTGLSMIILGKLYPKESASAANGFSLCPSSGLVGRRCSLYRIHGRTARRAWRRVWKNKRGARSRYSAGASLPQSEYPGDSCGSNLKNGEEWDTIRKAGPRHCCDGLNGRDNETPLKADIEANLPATKNRRPGQATES